MERVRGPSPSVRRNTELLSAIAEVTSSRTTRGSRRLCNLEDGEGCSLGQAR